MEHTAKSETIINAPAEKVWEAFTNPDLVKEWLFGTQMEVLKWEVGGEIKYKGEWQGNIYEDKGTILEIVPMQKLVSSYWSSMSGLSDSPENYQTVAYELFPEGDATRVVITQEGSKTEESAKHSESNWNQVLISMKNLLEK